MNLLSKLYEDSHLSQNDIITSILLDGIYQGFSKTFRNNNYEGTLTEIVDIPNWFSVEYHSANRITYFTNYLLNIYKYNRYNKEFNYDIDIYHYNRSTLNQSILNLFDLRVNDDIILNQKMYNKLLNEINKLELNSKGKIFKSIQNIRDDDTIRTAFMLSLIESSYLFILTNYDDSKELFKGSNIVENILDLVHIFLNTIIRFRYDISTDKDIYKLIIDRARLLSIRYPLRTNKVIWISKENSINNNETIMYAIPSGINIITGPSGSGKSFLSDKLFDYYTEKIVMTEPDYGSIFLCDFQAMLRDSTLNSEDYDIFGRPNKMPELESTTNHLIRLSYGKGLNYVLDSGSELLVRISDNSSIGSGGISNDFYTNITILNNILHDVRTSIVLVINPFDKGSESFFSAITGRCASIFIMEQSANGRFSLSSRVRPSSRPTIIGRLVDYNHDSPKNDNSINNRVNDESVIFRIMRS